MSNLEQLGEDADRLTILTLKKMFGLDVDEAFYDALRDKVLNSNIDLESLRHLLLCNLRIWDLESDIRNGKEGYLGLEEVGRRAILIRDINRERVTIKNRFNTQKDEKHVWGAIPIKSLANQFCSSPLETHLVTQFLDTFLESASHVMFKESTC